MAAPLYTDVCAKIRAFLDDLSVPGGATYTDSYCQVFVEAAQQSIVSYLIANGVEQLKFRTETPLTVTAGTTILDYSVAVGGTAGAGIQNILPDDLIVPDQLFEAKVGGANEEFVPMAGPFDTPRIVQTDTLGYWDWRDGRIHLLGSTQSRDVRMVYWSSLPAVNPLGTIKVIGAGNAVAALAASTIARKNGLPIADSLGTFDTVTGDIGGQAGWECKQIVNAQIKADQAVPVRRTPAFGRDRYIQQSYWVRGRI